MTQPKTKIIQHKDVIAHHYQTRRSIVGGWVEVVQSYMTSILIIDEALATLKDKEPMVTGASSNTVTQINTATRTSIGSDDAMLYSLHGITIRLA